MNAGEGVVKDVTSMDGASHSYLPLPSFSSILNMVASMTLKIWNDGLLYSAG